MIDSLHTILKFIVKDRLESYDEEMKYFLQLEDRVVVQ